MKERITFTEMNKILNAKQKIERDFLNYRPLRNLSGWDMYIVGGIGIYWWDIV